MVGCKTKKITFVGLNLWSGIETNNKCVHIISILSSVNLQLFFAHEASKQTLLAQENNLFGDQNQTFLIRFEDCGKRLTLLRENK